MASFGKLVSASRAEESGAAGGMGLGGLTGSLKVHPGQPVARRRQWCWDGGKRGCFGEMCMRLPSNPRDSTGKVPNLRFGELSDGRGGSYNSGLAVTGPGLEHEQRVVGQFEILRD